MSMARPPSVGPTLHPGFATTWEARPRAIERRTAFFEGTFIKWTPLARAWREAVFLEAVTTNNRCTLQNAVKREMTWRRQTASVLTLYVHPHSMWPLGA